MNDAELKVTSKKGERSRYFQRAFAKHLSSSWNLSVNHRSFLEIAISLFEIGSVGIPISSKRISDILSLLDPELMEEKKAFLEGKILEELIWPDCWMESAFVSKSKEHVDKSSPFVIASLEEVLYLYPEKLFKEEVSIADFASKLFQRPFLAFPENPLLQLKLSHEAIEAIERLSLGLKIEQKRALFASLLLGFTIITGGPGTGKSFTASRIAKAHEILQGDKNEYCHIVIAAPTGKAVCELEKRFSQLEMPTSKMSFTTLHRLLQMTPSGKSHFKEPFFDASLIIVDECSMIDMEIFSLFLSKIHPRTRLVLIGDPNQLPPVGAGDVFASLCQYAKEVEDCGFISLGESIRFENQKLREVAELCLNKDPRLETDLLEKKWLTSFEENFSHERYDVQNTLFGNWRSKSTLFDAKDPLEALTALKSAIILSSLREGPFGVKNIGEHFLEKALLHKASFIPILFTRNDDGLQIQNGLLGVLEIDRVDLLSSKKSKSLLEGKIYYMTSSGVRSLCSKESHLFELAFAISVHKSQGSEFDHVFCLLPRGSERFGNSLIYTAATRAKKSLHFYSSEKVLLKTLLFPSGNLAHLCDRLRSNGDLNKRASCDETNPLLVTPSLSSL